jgi:8-oxo-dGTP diphosphatase
MIEVVAAVIERAGRVLLCQRPLGKHHGGLWEFPGGKVEPGEAPGEALGRELLEELGVGLSGGSGGSGGSARTGGEAGAPEAPLLHRDEDAARAIAIEFRAASVEGEPRCLEHLALCWVSLEEASRMPLAPADLRFVEYALRRLRGDALP